MSKRFTLPDAESLLPEITRSLEQALELKRKLDLASAVVDGMIQKIMAMGGMVVDPRAASRDRIARDTLAGELKSAVDRVQSHGCVVKDLDSGLVDFPTWFEGREVYLCWKLGEESIGFWHGTEEGFAGRKPIDRRFRGNHQGDPVQ